MEVYIASDHIGITLKEVLINYLTSKDIQVTDLGPFETTRVNYPDFAKQLCEKILKENNKSKGILICGTGIGMSISANRFKGIRAALCTNEYMAKMTVQHNNANVLCLGSRVVGEDHAKSIVESFLSSKFEGGRHLTRVIQLDQLCDA